MYDEALLIIKEVESILPFFAGINSVAEYTFYYSLILCSLFKKQKMDSQKNRTKKKKKGRETFEFARGCTYFQTHTQKQIPFMFYLKTTIK